MFYLRGFTSIEGAGGLLRRVGCHPLFNGAGAMLDSRPAVGMARVLSVIYRVLKQMHQGQYSRPDTNKNV